MKKGLFSKLLFILSALALDGATKAIALRHVLPLQSEGFPFGGIGIFDCKAVSFSLNTVVNTGIACGLFPEYPSLLLGLRLCIIAGLFGFLFFRPAQSSFPLWLIAAGALGNVVDMICYGHVIDFFHFRFFGWSFPIFNVADSLITVGAVLLFFWPKPNAACQGH